MPGFALQFLFTQPVIGTIYLPRFLEGAEGFNIPT
jgi:hypothetical protein